MIGHNSIMLPAGNPPAVSMPDWGHQNCFKSQMGMATGREITENNSTSRLPDARVIKAAQIVYATVKGKTIGDIAGAQCVDQANAKLLLN
jgi:hypothetical protein